MTDTLSPYQILHRLASSSLLNAQQLPAQMDSVQQWNGIGFSVMGIDFVIPMDELAEMLEVPPYTRLPGVRSWVKGVANIRGRLLPLFDLAAFYAGTLMSHKKLQRLLVIDNDSVYAGLWVDQVFGMQYFDQHTRQPSVPQEIPQQIAKYIDGSFESGGRCWSVFSAQALSQDEDFLNVAIG